MKKEKGITLIVLVVTIVVLIILAGISINLLLSKNGIITKAVERKDAQEIISLTEKLELEKAPVGADNLGRVSLDNYLNQIKTNKIIEEKDILPIIDGVEIKDDCYILVKNKYKYLLEEEENGNLKITYQGIPIILNIETQIETNQIKVKTIVENKYKSGAIYRFYIKTNKIEEYDKKAEEKENGEYTYTGLTQGLTYYIKIEVETKEGLIDSKQIAIKTGKIPEINIGDIIFDTTPEGWTKGNKETTVSSKIENYELQYQKNVTSETIKDESKWIKYEGTITSEKNENIYVRLWDGVNAGNTYAVQNVIGIDKTNPTSATIIFSGETTSETLPTITNAKVTHIDVDSGVDIVKSKWVYNTTSTEIGTNETDYTGGTFSGNGQSINLISEVIGTYYLHILTVDNVGNKLETIKGPITVEVGSYHTHIGNTSQGGECYKPNGHTHNSTCSTKNEQYTYSKRFDSRKVINYIESNGTVHYMQECPYCGSTMSPDSPFYHMHNVTETRVVYTCGSPVNQWILDCKKTATTIDNYKISY